jgi:hypothetical protein
LLEALALTEMGGKVAKKLARDAAVGVIVPAWWGRE